MKLAPLPRGLAVLITNFQLMYNENKDKDKDYAGKIMLIMPDEFDAYQDSLCDRLVQVNPNLVPLTVSTAATSMPDPLTEF